MTDQNKLFQILDPCLCVAAPTDKEFTRSRREGEMTRLLTFQNRTLLILLNANERLTRLPSICDSFTLPARREIYQ